MLALREAGENKYSIPFLIDPHFIEVHENQEKPITLHAIFNLVTTRSMQCTNRPKYLLFSHTDIE